MNEQSALKKARANKKLDKTLKLTERSQLSIGPDYNDDSSYKEPYQCTGRFSDDFQNLCRQSQINYIPIIIPRAKRPTTPISSEQKIEKPKIHKKQSDSFQSFSVFQAGITSESTISQKQAFIDMDEKDTETEMQPKTYVTVKDRYEYFKPKIHVELENAEKQETVSEIFIRGWKIDLPIIQVLQECLPMLERLNTLNFWNCGLNEDGIEMLVKFLPKCLNLKNLYLDGNPIKNQCFHKLIGLESTLQNVSLKCCNVDDIEAQFIGLMLGNLRYQNSKLLVLDLSNNLISDDGAISIAKGLRLNRTLLTLNLSGNAIGDLGAAKLAESLSRFQLNHDEIIQRRMTQIERFNRFNRFEYKQLQSPLSSSKKKEKLEIPERPPSHGHGGKEKTVKEKDREKLGKKEKNEVIANSMSNRDRSKSKDATALSKDPRESSVEKQGTLKVKKEIIDTKQAQSLTKRGSITNEKAPKILKSKTSKKNLKEQELAESSDTSSLKSANGARNSILNTALSVQAENDSFIEEVEAINGELWMPGNRTLISLNLSRNSITLKTVNAFILCLQYQQTLYMLNKTMGPGLLRLNLKKNLFPISDEANLKLVEILKTKDPLLNKPESPIESTPIPIKETKETVKAKTSSNKH